MRHNLHLPSISPGAATPQPAPELPPRDWDERLTTRGVSVVTPTVLPGDTFWRVVKARWYNEQEAGGRRHIYVEALNEDGRPLVDIPFEVSWPSGVTSGRTNGRTGFDAGNFPMSPSLNEFSVRIADGTPSELVEGIGMGADGNPGIHTATLLTFQRVTMPVAHQPQPEQPKPQPQPAPVGILDPLILEAIVLTESGGSGYNADGRLKIRIEAHLLLGKTYGNPTALAPYFRSEPGNYLDGWYRTDPNGAWIHYHNQGQAGEWAAFEFARQLDEAAALRCTSMGAGQVMGFNHARVGYASPRMMFDAFQRSELAQAVAVINYCLADPALVDAIRRKDWVGIVRGYNGAGLEHIYEPRLKDNYRRVGGAL